MSRAISPMDSPACLYASVQKGVGFGNHDILTIFLTYPIHIVKKKAESSVPVWIVRHADDIIIDVKRLDSVKPPFIQSGVRSEIQILCQYLVRELRTTTPRHWKYNSGTCCSSFQQRLNPRGFPMHLAGRRQVSPSANHEWCHCRCADQCHYLRLHHLWRRSRTDRHILPHTRQPQFLQFSQPCTAYLSLPIVYHTAILP